jgi:hypothetical protein
MIKTPPPGGVFTFVIPANDCMDAGGRATQERLPEPESRICVGIGFADVK